MSNKDLLELVLSSLADMREDIKANDKKIDSLEKRVEELQNEIKGYRSFVGGVLWTFGCMTAAVTFAIKYFKVKFGFGG